MLEKYLNRLKTKKKKVLFIDEFPWIASSRSKFLMFFEHFWNTYCTKRTDLVVVVCGSAASFMVNKIIRNKGGLHNRLSAQIQLLPFTLKETEQFLISKNVRFNHYDILQLYMTLGGVPHYLNKVKKGESVAQTVDRICFDAKSDLANEFNEVFTSLFTGSKKHEKIVRELAKNKKGVTCNELLKQCKLGSGGVFSKSLDELIQSGFVKPVCSFWKKNKDSLFRLSDEYSLFYLKFIESNPGQGAGTWEKVFPKQTYKSWTGFVFESVCLKHVQQIKNALGVQNIYSIQSSWHNNNAQIDLVIDRDDNIINLCEIKFYKQPFTINKLTYQNFKKRPV